MSEQKNQNSFLGDMQTVIRGQVESLTRYEINNERGLSQGGSIWVSKPTNGENPNVLGNELIKIKMPFEMFDQKKAEVEARKLIFPCQMEILCEITMGGQNKAVLTALSMKVDVEPEQEPGKKADQIEDKDIDKTTGEILNGTDKTSTGTTRATQQQNQLNKP